MQEIPVSFILTVVYILYVILLTFIIILDNKSPEVAIGWLLAIILIPYVGVVFYLFGGIDWKRRKIVKYRPEEVFKEETSVLIAQQKKFLADTPPDIDNDTYKAILLTLNSSGSVITLNNKCDFIFDGGEAMELLLEDLRNAEKFIHMEFFIWRSDILGDRIADVLIDKAGKGVDIRLIFDGVGSFTRISYKYRRRLRRAGIKYRYFLDPFNPLFGRLLNYRNHRKIVVIDGQVGFSGGMNIGQEYITGGNKFPTWRDTGMRLEGECIQFLEGAFLSDWANSGSAEGSPSRFFPPHLKEVEYKPMQVVCSGPDSKWHAIQQLFFTMIANANHEILIQSPYFIPDAGILSAMETAALAGVKVRVMMAGLPDKKMPFWAAQTYFIDLLEAGVEFYLYYEGFMHSKIMVADELIATAGTCNMDIRSLHLHYEINCVYYDHATITTLREQFYKDTQSCLQITLENIKKQNIFKRFRNSFCRILSPVL
ncbi:MAG: cardiolipin synthase [Spirochaetales bacterium]|nr:cardiolipin synthase [Spirochaetales bacterium]